MQVFAYDAERLGPEKVARLVAPPVGVTPGGVGRPDEPRRFMRMEDGHCAALDVSPSGHFTCTVYEDRPTVCRSLEMGSPSCLEARATGHGS